MEKSPNQNLLPMQGTIERETKRKAVAAAATRLVIRGFNLAGDYVSQDVPGLQPAQGTALEEPLVMPSVIDPTIL